MLNPQAQQYLTATRAANTITAYNSDWSNFCRYCESHQAQALPASVDIVANYIADLSGNICANSISRKLTAINQRHIIAGLDSPTNERTVKSIMYAIKRKHGTAQTGKRPITPDILSKIIAKIPDTLTGKRDKAILLLGFGAALRRSEIVSLTVNDISRHSNGLIIKIGQSKTDQTGASQTVAIPYAPRKNICPVTALTDWLTAAQIKQGHIFRAFMRGEKLKDGKMCDKDIALIIKHYCAIVGLDATQYSGHSLRRGFATTAARANAGLSDIMRQTRHKSIQMVSKYIDEGKIFDHNALNYIWAN